MPLCRQTVLELNSLVLLLNTCCKRETCPKMTTTEKYVFMCTVHTKGDVRLLSSH